MNLRRIVDLNVLAALGALAAGAGCGRPASQAASTSASPGRPVAVTTTSHPATSAEVYKLVGVVKGVDPEKSEVLIRHEAIPGFMDAMTMAFTLKDRSAFDDLRVGDEVEGTLRVEKEGGEVNDYDLADLVVTRPAPAPGLTLKLSGGQPTLEAKPRVLQPGDPVPDFAVTTQDGTVLRLSDLRGKVVVLTFVYTRCPLPDFCPLMDRKFSELADRVSAVPGRADHVRLLSVSFDPEHDTPEVLRKHATMRGARPPLWTYAVASHEDLAKVAPALGLTYGPREGEVMHNLSTAVIGPDGTLARLETGPTGKTWAPADVLKTMYSLITGAKP
jgi:protein SCO1/2